jgi:endoglucanase
MSRLIRTFAALAALGLAAGCSSAPGVDEASVAGAATKKASPAPASPFWVDPAGSAA